MLVKICGMRDPEMAAHACEAGADYIGMVFYKPSRRSVSLSVIQEIVEVTRKNGKEPVLVVVDLAIEQIIDMCEKSGIKIVQLHGSRVRGEQRLLPENIRRIYACSVEKNGAIVDSEQAELQHLNLIRDFVLFDGLNPGSGQVFDWNQFNYSGVYPWFLSGGMRVDNVVQAIRTLKPTGVDVSSGVENDKGHKDKKLISAFIQTVRKYASIPQS